MFGLERSSSENLEKQVKSNVVQDDQRLTDPIEIAEQELFEELSNFEKKAGEIAKYPHPKSIENFSHEIRQAKEEISVAGIREYGYNPPEELMRLHSKIEDHYNKMIRNEVACSYKYQAVMNDLNELQSITSNEDKLDDTAKARMNELIEKLNNTNLDFPISHPGIYSKNDKPGLQIKFSEANSIDVIKREAGIFYSQCESSMHQLFIFIQKLFNDLLSIFDTAKASLRNDAINTMVRNQNK